MGAQHAFDGTPLLTHKEPRYLIPFLISCDVDAASDLWKASSSGGSEPSFLEAWTFITSSAALSSGLLLSTISRAERSLSSLRHNC